MLIARQILASAWRHPVRGVGVLALCAAATACGQKGPLYLPTEPAARDRATLPQTLRPGEDAAKPAQPATAPKAPQ